MDTHETIDPAPQMSVLIPLSSEDAKLLRELSRSMMCDDKQQCVQVLIRRAHAQQFLETPTATSAPGALVGRPLVSLGQGEYRHNVMPEDV